jgi:hypothetical protein
MIGLDNKKIKISRIPVYIPDNITIKKLKIEDQIIFR